MKSCTLLHQTLLPARLGEYHSTSRGVSHWIGIFSALEYSRSPVEELWLFPLCKNYEWSAVNTPRHTFLFLFLRGGLLGCTLHGHAEWKMPNLIPKHLSHMMLPLNLLLCGGPQWGTWNGRSFPWAHADGEPGAQAQLCGLVPPTQLSPF